MSVGRFESMTLTPEFRELLEDWRVFQERQILSDIKKDILADDDAAQTRRVAFSAGALVTLESFDSFISMRIKREHEGLGRPRPRGLAFPDLDKE